jgi:hypothetical protein
MEKQVYIHAIDTLGQEVALVTSNSWGSHFIFGKVYRITERKVVINVEGKFREFSRIHGKELKVSEWNTQYALMDAEEARKQMEIQIRRKAVRNEIRSIKEALKNVAEYPLNEGTEDKLIELATRIKKSREE